MRKAWDCSVSDSPASILTSTALTAAVAVSRLRRPWGVSRAGSTLPTGADLATSSQPGIGVAIWLHATDVQEIHDALMTEGHTIVSPPVDGPFGRTFTFADPDGYHITLHDRA